MVQKTLMILCFLLNIIIGSSVWADSNQEIQYPSASVEDISVDLKTLKIAAKTYRSEISGGEYVELTLNVVFFTRACDPRIVLRGAYSNGYDLFGQVGHPPRLAVSSPRIGCSIVSGAKGQTTQLKTTLLLDLIEDEELTQVFFGIGDSHIYEIQLPNDWVKSLNGDFKEINVVGHETRSLD